MVVGATRRSSAFLAPGASRGARAARGSSPTTSTGIGVGAGAALGERWTSTVDPGAGAADPARLAERVDGEWSFVETLRHLIFVTDIWVGDVIEESAAAYHPWGLPPDFFRPCRRAALGLTVDATPVARRGARGAGSAVEPGRGGARRARPGRPAPHVRAAGRPVPGRRRAAGGAVRGVGPPRVRHPRPDRRSRPTTALDSIEQVFDAVEMRSGAALDSWGSWPSGCARSR